MSFFLGIDAGASKTECVLADASGTVLARGSGGPANLRRTPVAILAESLSVALSATLHTAGLRRPDLEAVCAGFAGAGQVEAREAARHILLRLAQPRHLFIVGDMEIALEAAVGAGRGVVLIAGTGSIAYGRNDLGQQARAGGHGPEVSDEGSAFDIGRRALELVAHGRGTSEPAPPLEAVVSAYFKLRDPDELKRLLVRPATELPLAGLLSAVVNAARGGDPMARTILLDAAAALARLAGSVLEALHLKAVPTRVALAGGVFAASPEVAEHVKRRLADWTPQAQIEPLTTSPAEGAVRLAQRLCLQQMGLPVGAR